MCGICGFFSKKGKLDKDSLERMNDVLAYRGPDDSGLFFKDGVGLGHKRLSVIDLSANAHQPMFNEDGSLALVFNGTIFNFPELREGLLERGHRFASNSDTEAILHLYEEWGEGLVESLKGQFAFAIWDSKLRRLIIARDRLGIKPLYFSRRSGAFLFASEARAIPASGAVPKELDMGGVVSFLESNSVAPPSTIFQGIEVLPAGHILIYDGEKVSVKKYWDIEFQGGQESASPRELQKNLRDSLFKSVESMLVGDVPVGVFLSGGVDSSVIAGILREIGRTDIETFSIGFAESDYNELPYARLVAAKNGSRHHEITITPQNLLVELPSIIRAMDQPSGDGLNTFLISKYTKKRVTVALSGLGGDELFFGYHIFKWLPRILLCTNPLFALPTGLRQGACSLAKTLAGPFGINQRFPEALRGRGALHAAYRALRAVFPEETLTKILVRPPEQFPFDDLIQSLAARCGSLSTREAASYMEIKSYMQNTLLRDSDVMAMAHALEVRFPLLDEAIVNLASAVPPSLKTGKKIFIDSIRDLIPREVWDRKKMGFSFPIPHWMRGVLKPGVMNYLSRERVERSGIFDHKVVARLLDQFYKGKGADFRLVWSLFLFELWRSVHIEGEELSLE